MEERRTNWPLTIFLLIVSAPIIIMYLWLFIDSISEINIESIWPQKFTLKNWRFLTEEIAGHGSVWTATLNTTIFATSVVTIVVALSSSAGYALSRLKFPFRPQFLGFVLLLHSFPSVTLIISIFLMLRMIGLYDTLIGVILVRVGGWKAKGEFSTHAIAAVDIQVTLQHFRKGLGDRQPQACAAESPGRRSLGLREGLAVAASGLATGAGISSIGLSNPGGFSFTRTSPTERVYVVQNPERFCVTTAGTLNFYSGYAIPDYTSSTLGDVPGGAVPRGRRLQPDVLGARGDHGLPRDHPLGARGPRQLHPAPHRHAVQHSR